MASELITTYRNEPILMDSGLHHALRRVAAPANVTVIRNGDPKSTIWCYFRVYFGNFPHEDPHIDIPYDPTLLTGKHDADFRTLIEQVGAAAYLLTP